MKLTSVFANDEEIPVKYTCLGDNISPPLTFDDIPAEARSLVLVGVDGTGAEPEIKWHVFNINPDTKWVAEGKTPQGGTEAVCSNNTMGYEGPCQKHLQGKKEYTFRLYAIDKTLDLPYTANFKVVKEAIDQHIVDECSLTGFVIGEK